jgi:hypothetical protein
MAYTDFMGGGTHKAVQSICLGFGFANSRQRQTTAPAQPKPPQVVATRRPA